jgi:hypothetical protein
VGGSSLYLAGTAVNASGSKTALNQQKAPACEGASGRASRCCAIRARSRGPLRVKSGAELLSAAGAKEPLTDCPMGKMCQEET